MIFYGSLGLLGAFSEYLENCSYFHNNIKMLLTLFSLVLPLAYNGVFQDLDYCNIPMQKQMENPASLSKPAMNEICKDVKQCQFSHYFFFFGL